MPGQVYFDAERGEAVVPWRGPRFPFWWAYACSAALWVLVIWGGLLSGWSLPFGLFISFMMLFALPWLVNWRLTAIRRGQPLAIGPDEMVGELVDRRPGYIRWADVETVALVHSLLGRGARPVHRNLLVQQMSGRILRFLLPPMTAVEMQQFMAVLETVSVRHGVRLLSDDNDEGEAAIRESP